MDVDAADLRNWTDRHAAAGEFPQLIRNLVLATGRADKVSFRGAGGVRIGGWDGIVEGAEGNPCVPDGRSGWELGVQRGPRQKAEADYAKPTGDPLGFNRATPTFVFATPRVWSNKGAWERAKQAEGSWRGIKVLDADDLLAWLDQAPAVELCLRRLLGKASVKGQDLESYWEEWSGATQPALSVEILTAGRDLAVQAVHRWLAGPASTLTLRGETEDEAIAFLFAALRRLPEEEARALLSRAIVVEDARLWRRLAATHTPHLLIRRSRIGRTHLPRRTGVTTC